MPVLNIVKKYNNASALNGIVISDQVVLQRREDLTNFLLGCHKAARYGSLDWVIIDYSWAISDKPINQYVLENPTGGKVGKIE